MSLYNAISAQTHYPDRVPTLLRYPVFLRKGRRDQQGRTGSLRLNDMIARLEINMKNTLASTTDMGRERHVRACEHAPSRRPASTCSRVIIPTRMMAARISMILNESKALHPRIKHLCKTDR